MDSIMNSELKAVQAPASVVEKPCKWCDEPVLPGEPHTLCEAAEKAQGKLF